MGDVVPLRRAEPVERPLPHSDEAEVMCLASMLQDRDALTRGLDLLRGGHFFDRARGRVFDAMRGLHAESTPVDRTTVETYLRGHSEADAGTTAALDAAEAAFPNLAHLEAHADIVLDMFERRQTITTCRRVALEAEGAVASWSEYKAVARRDLGRVVAPRTKLAGMPIGAVVREARLHVEQSRDRRIVGVRFGFESIQNLVGLLARKRQHILAGRSEHGKTALAFQILCNVASTEPHRGYGEAGYFVSADMSRRDLVFRGACSMAGVDVLRVELGMAEPDEMHELAKWLDKIAALPIVIDDKPAPAAELAERVARHKEAFEAGRARDAANNLFPRCRLQLVAGDHAQRLALLASGLHPRAEMREKIAATSNGWLSNIAEGLDVATLLLSQMNRDIESKARTTRWPIKSDLYGATELEADASTILAVHRPELLPKPAAKWMGMAAIVRLKARFGGGRMAVLGFDKGRFYEPTPHYAEQCQEDVDE